MEKSIVNWSGKETGAVETLHDGVFAIEPNDHAIWLDVRRIQAAGRQGTHQSKERSETAGSTRKLYRQKGTGGACGGCEIPHSPQRWNDIRAASSIL